MRAARRARAVARASGKAGGGGLLVLRDVVVRFGTKVVLDGVSLEVRAGEAIALVGPNGSGKSTLLAACGGLLKITGGRIELLGREVGRAGTRDARWLRAHVGIALQFPERGFFAATVREELLFTPRRVGKKGDLGAVLARVGLPAEILDRSPFSFSGGEKRRLALAAAVAHDPRLLLFDEPEAGLDDEGRQRVGALLREHALGGGAALVATHDVEGAVRWADRIVLLTGGRIQGEARAAEWERGEWPGWILPFLEDEGRAAAVQRAGKARGVDLPPPYRDPLEFLEALERQREGRNDREGLPGAGRP